MVRSSPDGGALARSLQQEDQWIRLNRDEDPCIDEPMDTSRVDECCLRDRLHRADGPVGDPPAV